MNRYYKYFLLVFIIFLGIILRLIGLNKPFGLGYDEAISYTYAIKSFPFGIINNLVNTDVHLPLYFLILNLWIKLFSNSDLVIRMLSVFFGALTCLLGYFCGRELLNKKVGFVTALLFSINSLAIYYSQEVRFYSLLLMLSTLVLLFLIKSVKDPKKINLIFLIISSILLIYTNTLSILFIFIIFLLFSLFIFLTNKDKLKFWISLLIYGQILLLPYYWLIHQIEVHRGSSFPDVLFFDNQVIFAIIQNLFSPVLVGLYNNPQNYFLNFLKTISISNTIFVILPIVLSLIFILRNNFKRPVNIIIITTVLSFVSIELIASYANKFTILSRYTLFVLPFIIILIASGAENFKNKVISYSILFILVMINLFYLFSSPNSAPKMTRIAGQKIPAIILNEFKIGKQDIVIFPIRDNLSDKYYENSFNKLRMLQIFTETYPYEKSQLDVRSYYKSIFISDNLNSFKSYYNKNIYEKLAPKSHLVICIQRDFMPYNPSIYRYILSNDNVYKQQPLLFMKLYKMANDLISYSSANLKLNNVYQKDVWAIFVFEKGNS